MLQGKLSLCRGQSPSHCAILDILLQPTELTHITCPLFTLQCTVTQRLVRVRTGSLHNLFKAVFFQSFIRRWKSCNRPFCIDILFCNSGLQCEDLCCVLTPLNKFATVSLCGSYGTTYLRIMFDYVAGPGCLLWTAESSVLNVTFFDFILRFYSIWINFFQYFKGVICHLLNSYSK